MRPERMNGKEPMMTENIEWGACPVCGGRVAGEIDSWECNGRLHVEQSYDNPPTCENGCPP